MTEGAGEGKGVEAAVEAAIVTNQSEQIGDLISSYTPKADAEPVVEGAEAEAAATATAEAEAAAAVTAGGVAKVAEVAGTKDQEITDLKAKIATMAEQIAKIGKPADAVVEPVEKPVEFKGDFFDNADEYNKAFEDQATMNKVLSKVSRATAQIILSNLPKVVTNLVKSQVEVQSNIKEFFTSNKDLEAHRQFVGFVSNDLMGKNPDWTVTKLFGELGKEVRTRIGLKQVADKGGKPSGNPRTPGGFVPPKAGGSRQSAAKQEDLTAQQKEINDLID